MTPETNSHTTPAPPLAADVVSSWDTFVHSIPQPVLPPEDDYSQVLGILRGTRPLLDSDRDWILPGVALLEGQLPVYDTLIDGLDKALKDLQVWRLMMQEVSKEFSSTLAPIRRLPSKLLLSVFRETQSKPDESPPPGFYRPTIKFMQDTLTLGHVCTSWRDIVVSSPELWSQFKITFPCLSANNPSLLKFPPFLKTILPLSGQLPLEIHFGFYNFGVDIGPSSGAAIEVLSLLLGERHRWKSADLNLPLDMFEQLRASSGQLACLESLILMTTWRRKGGPLGDVRNVFIDAPSLQKVVWHESIGCGSFAFPSQITHLAASFTAIHDLHTHSLLEELHLEEGRGDDIPFLNRITLPNVRRLSVSSLKSLRHLCLPSLEDLTFDNYFTGGTLPGHADADVAAATLSDFIRSSHCSLTSLATGTSIVYASNFIQETLPLLASLTSIAFQFEENSERRFYDTLMSPNVLPNLQHLVMRLPLLGMEDVSQDALSAMLVSRGQYLLSVRIECPIMRDDKHVDILNTLEPLRQFGTDLRAVEAESSVGISFGDFA
ncbi:hypothetical protein EV421DRAFT_2015406 [Armillaria borealis]|uniref:F-box domain-containing protein n=1 Tax=Armillaria borealis TaxID=47425 RepID=A0AA39N080_9AGAR|nr:hypothetical protein EV421DRAFT_2015406 [Armillaria borealis]